MSVCCLSITPIKLHAKTQHAVTKNKGSSTLFFSLSDRHGFPVGEQLTNFDCSDKIYAVTELSNFKGEDKHGIEFRWIDPHGETRERTRYDFFMRSEPTTKLWAWLELSRAKGAGMIQWLNPAAGLEEFIGEWKLELLLDGKTINNDHFEVNC